jgi:hypothetical protein
VSKRLTQLVKAVVTSRVGAVTFDNVLAGGLIGAVVDRNPNPARPAMQPAAEPAKAEESKK